MHREAVGETQEAKVTRFPTEGETEIELVYHRSWENEDPLQTFRFTVNIG